MYFSAATEANHMFAVNPSAVELGYILKLIPGYKFSMDTFEDRLRFQKTVYLLQAFGINRGYDFSWYLRGPYCSLASHDGYDLRAVYALIPDGGKAFQSDQANKTFERFCRFVYRKTADELEIAAAIHYLKHSEPWDDGRVRSAVENKQARFTKKDVSTIWDDMVQEGLI